MHPGPGGGPDLESGFGALRFGLPSPPSLAHRLDRDTSGCLVLGRHPKALRRLGALFAAGQVEKVYWAVVDGAPADLEGRIETGLKKLSRGTGWRMVVDPAGQRAVTDYRVLGFRRWPRLARTAAAHRAHSSDPGSLRGARLPGCWATGLWPARAVDNRSSSTPERFLPLYPARPPIAATAPVPPHMLAALATARL